MEGPAVRQVESPAVAILNPKHPAPATYSEFYLKHTGHAIEWAP